MKKYLNLLPFIVISILLLVIYRAWFFSETIVGGDMSYMYKSMLNDYQLLPYAWQWSLNGGFGGFSGPYLFTYFPSIPIIVFGKLLQLDWNIVARLCQLFLFIVIAIFSTKYFINTLFPKSKWYLLSIGIVLFNTYTLMLVGGGQTIVALAYAFAPVVLASFIKVINCKDFTIKTLKLSVIAGLVLSIQIMLDVRFVYVTLIAVGVYFIFRAISLLKNRQFKKLCLSIVYIFILPASLSVLINAYWMLATLLNKSNPIEDLGAAYSSADAVRFLSFAKLENTLSLLHPNWPENIFGKVSFMRSEFLIYPLLAFASLLFVRKSKKEEKQYVLYFSLLGLLGAFLAKGANDPFGDLYIWLFDNVPGFIMFRDATKWYVLIVLSYIVLIPLTLSKVITLLSDRSTYSKFIVLGIVLCVCLFSIRPALLGELRGTFTYHTLPNEYKQLEQFLSQQDTFYRTLWVPNIQRYGYTTSTHPAITVENLFRESSVEKSLAHLTEENSQETLQEAGIKYIIVPLDSEGELFVEDRKYSEKKYIQTITTLEDIAWITKVREFGKIQVFEVSNPKDKFWSTNSEVKLSYTVHSPVKISLVADNARKGDIVILTDTFDQKWIARVHGQEIEPKPYEKKYTSFVLPDNGTNSLEIEYRAQNLIYIGGIITIGTLLLVGIFLMKQNKK